jgi:methionyl-tRNA formyltransferase
MTRPDRPAGRGLAPTGSPVKKLAAERGVPVLQPPTLKGAGVLSEIRALGLDAIVTAAYGLIFPQELLDIPKHGSINIHASLLPRWRGAAPIQRALLAGDRVTGVTIMRMDAGLDTGPVLVRREIPIAASDTAGTLTERLARLGGELVIRALDGLEAGELTAVPQPAEGVSYAGKLAKSEFRVDWRDSSEAVDRRVRASNPQPGASARLRGIELKIWSGSVAEGSGTPGEVLGIDQRGLRIACGDGAFLVAELQRAGGKRLTTAEFRRGFPLSVGERFES